MDTHNILDALIVGGGPAGLSAALILTRCCKRIAVIDAGHPRNEAAQMMHGFLSRDGFAPLELLSLGRAELKHYGVEVITDSVASACIESAHAPFKTCFSVKTRGGIEFTARKLLLATGMKDELPSLPGVTECYGITLHHCPYCDGHEHRDKHLLAFGYESKDAVGLGLALRGWSSRVTVLSHGQPLDEELGQKVVGAGLAVLTNRIIQLRHDQGRLLGVELESVGFVPADAFFFSTPQHGGSDLARSLGCQFDVDGMARTDKKKTTCIPGLFLAGDVDGDVQFVIVAAAEGATAAVALNRELQIENGWA